MTNMIADLNFQPPPPPPEGLRWRDFSEEPFLLEGFPWWKSEKTFRRLPASAWNHPDVPDTLRHVAAQNTGGLLRFITDSTVIALKVKLERNEFSTNCTINLLSGFDVYEGTGNECRFSATLGPTYPTMKEYATFMKRRTQGLTEIRLYFPLQNPVSALEVGLDAGAQILPPPPHLRKKPILFYGSSITHGFCASRPGLTYPARVCRELGAPLVNMGYGGNCRGQICVAQAIAEQEMDAFVYDYDHNSAGPDELRDRHALFLQEILKVHPKLPVVILSAPSYYNDEAFFGKRAAWIQATYETFKNHAGGIEFIHGRELFPFDTFDSYTVDRLHPNDQGFLQMANLTTARLKKLLHLE